MTMDDNFVQHIHSSAIIYENVKISDNVKVGEYSVLGRKYSANQAVVVKDHNFKNELIIGKNTVISAHVTIYQDVIIGEDCLIGDNTSILGDVQIGNNVLISRNVTINAHTKIGNNTRIMDLTHITGHSKIGNNVFISVGVMSTNDNFFGVRKVSYQLHGVDIEDFVKIGPGVVLLPYVKIGKGSVIAAGSVVKQDIPAGVLAAGNPAKVITKLPDEYINY